MPKTALSPLVFALLSVSLAGCTSSKMQEGAPEPVTATQKQTAAHKPSKLAGVKEKKKTIAPETLYDLLIAEMGGKVNRLEIALGKYMRQAHLTKDPLIIERYAKIATYMQAYQAIDDATELWLSIEPNNVNALHLVLMSTLAQDGAKEQSIALRALLNETGDLNLLLIEQQIVSLAQEKRAVFHGVIDAALKDTKNDFAKNHQLWYVKAKLNSLNENHKMVISDVKSLQKLNEKFLPSYVLLVDAYEKTEQLHKAKDTLKDLTRLDPENKKIRLYYARLLVRVENYKEAKAQFEALIEIFPNDLDLLLTAGVLCAQSGDDQQARVYFETLLSSLHRTNEAHFQLGLLETRAENSDSAIASFLAVTPSPVYQEARFRAAQLLSQQDQVDEAVALFEEAAKAQPQAKDLYLMGIVEILSSHSQFEPALERLNEALAATPRDTHLLYSRAILYSQMERFTEAEIDLRDVIEMEPDNVSALNALGYTLADRNVRLDEAQILLDKAAKLSPNDPPILDSLGWLAFRKGDLRTAKQYLERAYELLKDHEIAAHLGEIYWLIGEKAQARTVWQEGLKQQPESKFIRSTLERLGIEL